MTYRSPNLALKRRLEFVFLALMVGFAFLTARLVWLQWVKHSFFADLAARVHVRTLPDPASRGLIRARNWLELAGNVVARDVCANPRVVVDPAATGRAVAELFGGDAEHYAARLSAAGQSAFVYLKRGVDREIAERNARALRERPDLKGVELRPAPRRVYPGGSLAAALLGYTDVDGKGIEGLELFYNRVLAGKDGFIIAEVDARQEMIPDTERRVERPVDGQDIVLTLDPTIQQFAERELGQAVDQYHAESGTVIVLDVRTGEVLAIANAPGYDPNRREAVPPDRRRCRAVTDIYEPGSTFKVITAAAALEERVSTDATCSGGKVVGVHTIHCAHGRAHGQCDLARTISQSCNIAAGTLAERVGAERLYQHIKQFGFLEKTGVELAGETCGWMGDWREWRPIRTFNVGFGQGIVVTPLQLLRAFAAIANDGVMVRPRLISRIGDRPVAAGEAPRRVLSRENARTLRRYMEMAVTDGTGKNAKIAHYSSAGKTGTAQIAQGGRYLSGAYVASFIGFLSAQQPRIAILVSVRHPKGAQYGGTVAAPVFREVARQMVSYLRMPPDAPGDERDGLDRSTFDRWRRQHRVGGPESNRAAEADAAD